MWKELLGAMMVFGGMLVLVPALAHAAQSVTSPIHLINSNGIGKQIGNVTFTQNEDGLDINVDVTGLPPGEHGMHIHENPSCAAAEKDGKMVAGQAAGSHYDPMKTGRHAGPGAAQGHKGDLPRLMVNTDGTARTTLRAPGLTLADVQGHSVIIHAGGDNYSDTPPLGGGGERIACGVIR